MLGLMDLLFISLFGCLSAILSISIVTFCTFYIDIVTILLRLAKTTT